MTIDEYQNQLDLLKEALKFYADEQTYSDLNSVAPIILDEHGSQARFALEQLEKLERVNKKLKEDYNRIIGETIKAIESTPFDLTGMIKTIKNDNGNKI